MRIMLAIGIFFLVLGAIYAFAAWKDYAQAQRQRTPGVIARRRIAIIFACIGIGMVVWSLVGG